MLTSDGMFAAVFVPFATALILSLIVVPICRRTATRLGYVAQPRTDRWHKREVPLFGGVGMVIAVFAGILLLGGTLETHILAGCAAAIFIVGLTDDLLNLKASTKLIAQIVVASALLFFGFSLNWTSSYTLNMVLTILWVVGITNAFNLLDNMDGLCGGIALIAGVGLLVGYLQADADSTRGAVQYLSLLLGAVAGFLVYNIHPASIFMGDAGSLFLGTSFAALTLTRGLASEQSSVISVIVPPVFILVIPILDTTLVTLSRLLSGRSAATGGRDHSSHRLVAIGLSEPRAVAVLWGLAIIAGLVGAAARTVENSWALLFVAVCLLAMAGFTAYLAHVRVYDLEIDPPAGGQPLTPLVGSFTYKRRVAEVILDFALITIGYYAAYRLRFEGPEFEANFEYFLRSLPIVLASHLTALFVVGAYRGMWRYFSLMDAVVFAKATALGTITSQLVILYLYRFMNYSRTVFVISAALLFVAFVLSRASFRLIGEYIARLDRSGKRLIIYGAGDAGAMALRELLKTSSAPTHVLGFIDDDPRKRRVRVQGYSVLGGVERLMELIALKHVDQVIVSTDRIPSSTVERLLHACEGLGVTVSRFRVQLEPIGLRPRPAADNLRPFGESYKSRRRQGGGDGG